MFKKIKKNELFRRLVCRALYLYVKFVFATGRVEIINGEVLDCVKQEKTPVIFTFWHEHLMMMPCFGGRHGKTHAMISLHGDGEILSTVMQMFGLGMVRGSSSRGGGRAAKNAVNILNSKENIAITPDGPRGPRRKASGGAVKIAELSGCPIIPIGFASSFHKRLNSWDKFIITYPFSRIVLCIGEPMHIAPDSDEKTATQEMEDKMILLTEQAEKYT